MAEQFRTPNAQFSSELYSFHIIIMLINSSFNSFASYAGPACVRPYYLHNYFMFFIPGVRRADPKTEYKLNTAKRNCALAQFLFRSSTSYASVFGPAATSALPASLPSYFAKFLIKRSARSLALLVHSSLSV